MDLIIDKQHHIRTSKHNWGPGEVITKWHSWWESGESNTSPLSHTVKIIYTFVVGYEVNWRHDGEEFPLRQRLQYFDLSSHFSPLQATKNVTTNDMLTMLSHFPDTKMWQQSHNFHQSKINSISCTFTVYHEKNKERHRKMQPILIWFVVTICCDHLLSHFYRPQE